MFDHNYGSLIPNTVSIYLSAVIEYLATEVIGLSCQIAKKNPNYKNCPCNGIGYIWTITEKNVAVAIMTDPELSELLIRSSTTTKIPI